MQNSKNALEDWKRPLAWVSYQDLLLLAGARSSTFTPTEPLPCDGGFIFVGHATSSLTISTYFSKPVSEHCCSSSSFFFGCGSSIPICDCPKISAQRPIFQIILLNHPATSNALPIHTLSSVVVPNVSIPFGSLPSVYPPQGRMHSKLQTAIRLSHRQDP